MSNERSGWRVVSSAAASQASARSREREEPRARGEREEQRARRERDEQRARGVASGVVGGGDTTSPPSAWIVFCSRSGPLRGRVGSRAHPSFVKPSWRVTEIHPCAEATRADSRILRILVNVRYWPVRAREVAQGFVKPSWRVTEIHDCEL